MRLFVGLDTPNEIIEALRQLQDRLKPLARIAWSPPSNWHITTKFIGHIAEDRLDEVKEVLASIQRREPIPIEVRGLGFYPNLRQPRVFWAGVEAPQELMSLAHETDEAVAQLNVPKEERSYSPHLTLARIKNDAPLHKLNEEIARLESVDFGHFEADRFYLYLSKPGPGGSVYTKLSEFPFKS